MPQINEMSWSWLSYMMFSCFIFFFLNVVFFSNLKVSSSSYLTLLNFLKIF